MSIKQLDNNQKEEIKKLFYYCFYEPPDWEWDSENWEKYFATLDLTQSLGYFVNGKMTSSFIIEDYLMFIRDKLMKMGGVAGVATYPQYRRKGQIKELHIEGFKLMRKNKQFVSALYPFKYTFYRKFGYEICCQNKGVNANPYNISLPKDFQPLKLRELSLEEAFKIIEPIREKFGSKYNILAYKNLKSWMLHFLLYWKNIFVIEDDNDEIVGCFISGLRKLDKKPYLSVREVITKNEKARLTVLDFVKKHGDQIDEFYLPLMGDECVTDYFDEVEDEKDFKLRTWGGAMFRVVDVEQAIQLLDFPNNLNFSFILQVDDEFAPWNQDPIEITITKGKGTVRKNVKEKPSVTCDIKAFSQLFIGYRSIAELLNLSKIKIKDEKLSTNLDQAFPKRVTRITSEF